MSAPVEREFTADRSAPAAARTFVTATVAGLVPTPLSPTVCDDIELVVSELVTNAVRAASPTVRVVVTFERGRVVLQVEDQGAGWPEQREAGIHDINGRGLGLVSALCVSWGVRTSNSRRKTVWAEIEV